jgi:hypothetical protein
MIFHPQFGIENPRVGGSIPPPGTIFKAIIGFAQFAFRV